MTNFGAAALVVCFTSAPIRAWSDPPPSPQVDIVEKLGESVPGDLPFIDSAGRPVTLRQYLTGRPIVLALVYYRCPALCGLLLGGLAKTLAQLDWRLGREFDAVTVSIDPDETPELAAKARVGYLQATSQPSPDTRWAFLTGSAASINALADSVGFRFQYLKAQRQFAHAAAIFVLTPDGRISRYLYGVEFPPKQLKLALFDAAGGRVGTSLERVILRCYVYDPVQHRYALFITRYYRVGGLLLLGGIAVLLGTLWRRDLQRSRA